MKSIKSFFLLLILAIGVISCKENPTDPPVTQPTPPTALTKQAANVTATKATLNGEVNGNGQATTVKFEYGTSISYGITINATPNIVNATVNANLEGLIPELLTISE